MIRSSERLEQFERDYARTELAQRSYAEALAIFEALWRHACELNPDFPGHWREDIDPDIELARVLNASHPPKT